MIQEGISKRHITYDEDVMSLMYFQTNYMYFNLIFNKYFQIEIFICIGIFPIESIYQETNNFWLRL